jgi:anti-sigma factor RsiW
MTKDPLYEHLREISWRRKLTPAEQASLCAWLAAHPEAQSDWETEASLSDALAGLPDAPVANNFTARVVASAQSQAGRQERQSNRVAWRGAWWQRWLPKSAFAAILIVAGLLCYNHVQEQHREELARSLATMSAVPAFQSPEMLKDFDAIAALGSAPPADEELLKVMQ